MTDPALEADLKRARNQKKEAEDKLATLETEKAYQKALVRASTAKITALENILNKLKDA